MKKTICILSSTIIGLSAVPLSYASASAEDTVIVSESTENIDWLPITMNDYEAFIAKYGVVSVHDKYIVYCDAVNYSTGDSVIMEQAGTAEIKKVKEYSITTDEPLPPGSKSYVVYVYEAVSAGTVEITISQGRTWDSNAPKDIKSTGFYKVDNDMTITVTDKLDVDNFKKGDVNMDGAFNVSDVVLLQKWLLAVPDVTLANWKSADLCEDGTLNVFDLCMMKHELINKVEEKYPVENPEVIDEFIPCSATESDIHDPEKFNIVIKCQYSDKNRIWTKDDFKGISNIASIKQTYAENPYRTILVVYLDDQVASYVIDMVNNIEALEMNEIKEFQFYDYATGVPEIK